MDRTEGVAKLNTAIQVIRESIEEGEGQFNIKMEVREGGREEGGKKGGGKEGGREEGGREGRTVQHKMEVRVGGRREGRREGGKEGGREGGTVQHQDGGERILSSIGLSYSEGHSIVYPFGNSLN